MSDFDWDTAMFSDDSAPVALDFGSLFQASSSPSAFDASSTGFDLSSIFSSPSGAPVVAPVLNLPTGAGIGNVFDNITNLITRVYAGEAAVEQAKTYNQISRARLANQLETVKTTPNIWLVLGLGAAGVFALQLMDRNK